MCSVAIISINFQILSGKVGGEKSNLANDSCLASLSILLNSSILVGESLLGGCILRSYPYLPPPGGPLIIYFDEIEDRCEVKRTPVKKEMRKEKQ